MILFIGSRGSGKTTIANEVVAQLGDAGYTTIRQFPGLTRRPLTKAVWTAVSLWRYFDSTYFTTLGFKGRSPRIIPSLYRLYLPLAFKRDIGYIKNNRADILVYDSNVLRALVAGVIDGSIDPTYIADFCARKIVPAVGVLVVPLVMTDPAEAVDRWVTRDRITLTPAEYEDAIAERSTLATALTRVADALASIEHVHIVHIDGTDAPKLNASTIVQVVTGIEPSSRTMTSHKEIK